MYKVKGNSVNTYSVNLCCNVQIHYFINTMTTFWGLRWFLLYYVLLFPKLTSRHDALGYMSFCQQSIFFAFVVPNERLERSIKMRPRSTSDWHSSSLERQYMP